MGGHLVFMAIFASLTHSEYRLEISKRSPTDSARWAEREFRTVPIAVIRGPLLLFRTFISPAARMTSLMRQIPDGVQNTLQNRIQQASNSTSTCTGERRIKVTVNRYVFS